MPSLYSVSGCQYHADIHLPVRHCLAGCVGFCHSVRSQQEGIATTAPAPTCYAKTRLAKLYHMILSLTALQYRQQSSPMPSLYSVSGCQYHADIHLPVRHCLAGCVGFCHSVRSRQEGIAFNPECIRHVAAVVTPILRHLHDVKGDETMHYDRVLVFKLVRMQLVWYF